MCFTFEVNSEHAKALIGIVRKKYKISRRLNAGANLIILAAFMAFLIGIVLLAYRNICGIPLFCIFLAGFILYQLYSLALPKT
jgi:hypothetical protein